MYMYTYTLIEQYVNNNIVVMYGSQTMYNTDYNLHHLHDIIPQLPCVPHLLEPRKVRSTG